MKEEKWSINQTSCTKGDPNKRSFETIGSFVKYKVGGINKRIAPMFANNLQPLEGEEWDFVKQQIKDKLSRQMEREIYGRYSELTNQFSQKEAIPWNKQTTRKTITLSFVNSTVGGVLPRTPKWNSLLIQSGHYANLLSLISRWLRETRWRHRWDPFPPESVESR